MISPALWFDERGIGNIQLSTLWNLPHHTQDDPRTRVQRVDVVVELLGRGHLISIDVGDHLRGR